MGANAAKQKGSDRRRARRIPIGLPVRVHLDGAGTAETLELRDVSATGCFLRTLSAPRVFVDQKVALGFVLPGKTVGLARGRVVRVEREGFAVQMEGRNGPFDEFLRALVAAESLAA